MSSELNDSLSEMKNNQHIKQLQLLEEISNRQIHSHRVQTKKDYKPNFNNNEKRNENDINYLDSSPKNL